MDMEEFICLLGSKLGLFGCVLNCLKCWILDTEFEKRFISESLELGIVVITEHRDKAVLTRV